MLITGIILVLIAAIMGAFASFLVKKGSEKIKPNLKSILSNKMFMLGIFLYISSNFFFIPALKYGKLSILYPFISLSYIISIFLSVKYLGEKMNKFKYLAILFIVLGVILVSLE
jgi:uncharacterized membrane protein